MPLRRWLARSRAQPGAPGLTSLTVTHDGWRSVMEDLHAARGRLLSLWGSREGGVDYVRGAALAESQGLIVSLPVRGKGEDTSYPGLDDLFPAAARMQRAIFDLSGLGAHDADGRPG